jgi:hypothetical protein
MIQSVVLTFDDGTTATFSGRAVCFEGEQKKIRDISFTPPQPLPADCSWGELESSCLPRGLPSKVKTEKKSSYDASQGGLPSKAKRIR